MTTTPTAIDAPQTIPQPPTNAEAPAAVQQPRRSATRTAARAAWWAVASDTPALVPWRWMAATDLTAVITHAAAPNLAWAAVTAAGASAATAGWAAWRLRESRLARHIKTIRTRRKIRGNAKVAVGAGSVWLMTAATWTPAGPDGIMQLTLLGGGLAIGAPYLWRNRRRGITSDPVAEIEAAPTVEDPRLTRFREHFCDHGPLTDARLTGFTTVPGGFQFHIELLIAHRGTFRDIKRLEDEIAALYGVPFDHVSVEPPEDRSARSAVITVLTATDAHERDEPWDGTSTYDPETGCVRLGRYADGAASWWRLHKPYSGIASGIVAGVQGSGKTGTLHVVSAEAGQAKLCSVCLGEGTCDPCDPRRICAVWMGDPQCQPFAVWRGRADLTAWGPLACVRMLSWLHAAMRYRADRRGRMEWTDHLGRRNTGKGWFDPQPGEPLVLGVIDEWPIISTDPELGPIAAQFVLDILREGRKVGIGLVLGTQEADVDVLGDRGVRNLLREFNACVHRTDRLAKQMLAIDGDPEDLPADVHGISYLKGPDKRSDIVHRTKHLPEYLRPGQSGVDVRELADRIAADPIVYDDAFLHALRPLGYTGQGQVLDDDTDTWDITDLTGDDDTDAASDETAAPAPPARPAVAAPSPQDITAVQHALPDVGSADLFDLMKTTGMSALEVSRAVDVLIADGHAVQTPSGDYAHA